MALKVEGSKLAMTHKHDWIIIVLLGIIEGILNLIEPFHRYIGAEMMADLKYPFHKDTIPMWAVPIYALFIPIIIFALFYRKRRVIYDFHHALLGLMFSSLITGVITDSIKDAVGRPRPNFYWRCFPDNNPVFDAVGDVACTGIASDIKEGYKSFPSGHTSWSFAGLGFLAWYLSGKVRVFDRRGHIAKICIVLLPLLIAALVGISRVDDYWHHWTDVFAGALIGITVSTICYLLLFPFPFHERGWAPHAFFHMRETGSANAEKSVELDLKTEAMECGTRVMDMTSYIEL